MNLKEDVVYNYYLNLIPLVYVDLEKVEERTY